MLQNIQVRTSGMRQINVQETKWKQRKVGANYSEVLTEIKKTYRKAGKGLLRERSLDFGDVVIRRLTDVQQVNWCDSAFTGEEIDVAEGKTQLWALIRVDP